MKNFDKKYGYVFIVLFFVLIASISYFTQNRITFADGEGFDGVKYVTLVEQLKNDIQPSGPAPFVYRLSVPYLVSLSPFKPLQAFLILNLVCSFIISLLLYKWLGNFIKTSGLAVLLTLFFMLHWAASIRFSFFYPATCDPLAILLMLLGLLVLQELNSTFSWAKIVLLTAIVLIGVFTREYLICFAFGIPCLASGITISDNRLHIHKKNFIRNIAVAILVFIVGLLGIYATHVLVQVEGDSYGFLKAVYRWMFEKSIFQYITGFYYVFGALTVLPFLFPNTGITFLKKQLYFVPFLGIAMVLIWIGGGDTERFVLWFSPLFLALLGTLIEQNNAFFSKKRVYIPISISLILTLRLFWPIPQFVLDDWAKSASPFFTVFGKNHYIDLWSGHGDKEITTINLLLYGGLSGYLFLVRYAKKIKETIKLD